MSLFKVKDWWVAGTGDSVDVHYTPNSLCIGNIDNNSEKYDKMAVGNLNGVLKIYKPGAMNQRSESFSPYRPSDLILEVQLKEPILQLELGFFVSGNVPRGQQLAILHPRRLVICTLMSGKGAVDHGYQFQLSPLYEHSLERNAFNMCCGPFGEGKGKDYIAVQSIDCTLTVFEHEQLLFTRFLPNSLLPGPLKYWTVSNSFITVSSSWLLESYRFETLVVAGDAKTKEESQNTKTAKKITPDWVLNIGEAAVDISVTPLHTGAASARALVLGERNIFCVSDVGELMFSIKLDYSPLSMFVTKSSREAVYYVVANSFNSLMFYENDNVRWSAHAGFTPTSVAVANFKALRGAIILLSSSGKLTAGYLGTDPTLFSLAPPSSGRDINWENYESEMKKLDDKIRYLSKSSGATLSKSASTEEDIAIKVHLVKEGISTSMGKVTIPGQVFLSLKRAEADDVRLHILAQAPISVNPVSTRIGRLDQSSAATVKFTITTDDSVPASNLSVHFGASFSLSGTPRFSLMSFELPAKLFSKPSTLENVKPAADPNAVCKITIDSNLSPTPMSELFTEFSIDSSAEAITVNWAGSNVSILAAKNSNRYRVQGPSLSSCSIFLTELANRLLQRRGQSLSFTEIIPIDELVVPIRQHLQARAELLETESRLAAASSQIIAVEKRLLSRVRDKTPANVDDMHLMLSSCQAEVSSALASMEAARKSELLAASTLAAAVRGFCLLVKLWRDLGDDEYSMLLAAMQPDILVAGCVEQGWEEMADSAIVYLLRSVLTRQDTSRDAVFNPTPLSMPTDNGDALLKHIKALLDRVAKGNRLTIIETSSGNSGSLKMAAKNPLQNLFDESSASSELGVQSNQFPDSQQTAAIPRPVKKKTFKKPPMTQSNSSDQKQHTAASGLKSLPPSSGPLAFNVNDNDDTTLPDLSTMPLMPNNSSNVGKPRRQAQSIPSSDAVPDLDEI